jgi:predicted branched-subunit amino acid permease
MCPLLAGLAFFVLAILLALEIRNIRNEDSLRAVNQRIFRVVPLYKFLIPIWRILPQALNDRS